jgi:hypothetical protein
MNYMKNISRTFTLAILFVLSSQAQANKLLMPGDLVYKHAKFEDQCEKCHTKFDKTAQSSLCADCHKEVHKDFADKSGSHGRLEAGKECRECHPDHKGRYALIITLDQQKFDHYQTDYPLKDGHADPKVKCESCHPTGKKYREAPSVCNECHKKGDKHKGMMGTDCERCHNEKSWKKLAFDHDKTAYKLLGRHGEAKCYKCHLDDNYKDTPKQCNTCHKKDDAHKSIFGTQCGDCHAERGWKTTQFDHDNKTPYPLLFSHKQIKCAACHKDDWSKGKLKNACISCHQKDDKHRASFGTKCDDCHTEKNWKESLFDHDRKTPYPLLARHQQVKCTACHKVDWVKGKLKTACVSCHLKDDKHKDSLGQKCETCHLEKGWKEINFDHDKQTKAPLLGKHKQAKCSGCHKSGHYADKMPTLCLDCHQKDDMHKGKFGPMCETCHSEKTWKETFFDHYVETGYRLLGKHVGPKCVACHKVRIYEDEHFRKDCIYCHAKNDVHKGKEGKVCEKCHTEELWKKIIGMPPK